MPGKTNGLTALEMRKQLLVVESELNRAQLAHDLQAVTARIHHVTRQLGALGTLASTMGEFGPMIAEFFKGFSRPKKNDGDEKASWLSRLFTGIRSGVDLWTAFRSDRG
jgi:hypothetical protein